MFYLSKDLRRQIHNIIRWAKFSCTRVNMETLIVQYHERLPGSNPIGIKDGKRHNND
jgi:hypothetical protein